MSLMSAQHRSRHQLNRKLINIRRGEGWEGRLGGPLWSPASCSLGSPVGNAITSLPSGDHKGLVKIPLIFLARPPPNRPRPYGIPGSRLRLMPVTAALSALHPSLPAALVRRISTSIAPDSWSNLVSYVPGRLTPFAVILYCVQTKGKICTKSFPL